MRVLVEKTHRDLHASETCDGSVRESLSCHRRNPPPPINFIEWDGLIKLCFNRKNKTLRAIFTTKNILGQLETSFKTYAALATAQSDGDAKMPARSTKHLDVMADEADETAPRRHAETRALVEHIVSNARFAEKRPSKMDMDDFLALLAAFNKAGLHFTGFT